MKIKQGDIFFRDCYIWVVGRTINRRVNLTRFVGSNGSYIQQTVPYYHPEKYFINKLTI